MKQPPTGPPSHQRVAGDERQPQRCFRGRVQIAASISVISNKTLHFPERHIVRIVPSTMFLLNDELKITGGEWATVLIIQIAVERAAAS